MDIRRIEDYITDNLTKNLDARYTFHTLNHARDVVSRTGEILNNNNDKADKNETLIAAWFMYIGFIKDYNNHVKYSQKIAQFFLSKIGFNKEQITRISKLIGSAWDGKEPISTEAEVLKDARTSFYASEDLIELIELQRLELLSFDNDTPPASEFRKKFIKILIGNHQYYTKYAIENWKDLKEDNIMTLVGKSLKAQKNKKKTKLKVKLKNQSPERAIQSLYRTQLRNHIKLSDIADTKANILLSVNAIIISLLLSNLIPRLDAPKNSYLIYPTAIFVIFSITSMIMSVTATRPKIKNESLIENDLNSKNTNFLFFGNFYTLSLADFKEKMKSIIDTKETIYESLTMDLYFLGVVLKKKYQLLRWTYTIFMIGIIFSVVAFAIALKYYGMDKEILEAVTPDPK